ncbi:MAG: hypothetical protein CM15mP2_0640 [Methanobacteriota archaeon]|nr:MAG: hypothetical protein CM15mP2_0640 [Euryarchaeota archaeon]
MVALTQKILILMETCWIIPSNLVLVRLYDEDTEGDGEIDGIDNFPTAPLKG